MPPFPQHLLHDLGHDCRRLLHGRGGYFAECEHLAIDWFDPVLLVTFYAEHQANTSALDQLRSSAAERPEIEAIVVQQRHLPAAPKQTIYGIAPGDPKASESGLHYHLSLDRNQNHGFFLDMKPGRDWVRSRAAGKKVLNLFAYTCSLSVAAIAGGADAVTNLDMASAALATGRENHRLNFDPATCRRASYLAHNLFKSWGRLKRSAPYDLILIDPPSNQAGSFVAEADYARIVRRLHELSKPASEILACLNSPHLGEGFLRDLFGEYQFRGRLPGAPGFEDRSQEAALKCLVFTP
jgi:23S rRNA (cytosine1962-C5)-methyltransferase